MSLTSSTCLPYLPRTPKLVSPVSHLWVSFPRAKLTLYPTDQHR